MRRDVPDVPHDHVRACGEDDVLTEAPLLRPPPPPAFSAAHAQLAQRVLMTFGGRRGWYA